MWIFSKSGFVSIVRQKVWPGKLLVRADLENFVRLLDEIGKTRHVIKETEKADYRFRTVASPRVVAEAVARTVAGIDYPNFKNAVHGDRNRDRAYMRVWSAMQELQMNTRGICLGCSLSPLMGAVYLQPVDDAMAKTGLFYARFMDDWVVLAPTHWKLRAVIRLVNETLAALKVQQHPDKTFVGRVSRGFDFLGYTFSTVGLTGLARKTVAGCIERINQLYEQGADAIRIGDYVRRWRSWVKGGLAGKSVAVGVPTCFELSSLERPFDAAHRQSPHHSPLLSTTTR